MEAYEIYQTPLSRYLTIYPFNFCLLTLLCDSYASKEMAHLFSTAHRSRTWRELWLTLAIAEKELGLPIPDEAIEQMKNNLDFTLEQFDIAEKEQVKRLHEVMSHIHTFGQVAPAAAGIIQYV
ncbi:hypothetical protein AZE42_13633 [Rhizopogon vesiculosus]|uniref:Adenylosuccinate lyase n=1 Tax=Rhizopogon vesiculosus TaxID=180088 RepID=A0A1J8QKI7_9AGAM|nr:hypothetical protein AZE42_13633 [Rhizopogon vesiculosus]